MGVVVACGRGGQTDGWLNRAYQYNTKLATIIIAGVYPVSSITWRRSRQRCPDMVEVRVPRIQRQGAKWARAPPDGAIGQAIIAIVIVIARRVIAIVIVIARRAAIGIVIARWRRRRSRRGWR